MKNITELGISPMPWKCANDVIHGILSKKEITICNAWETSHVSKEQAIANSRLIVAAPELYGALLTAVDVISQVIGADDMSANCHNGTVKKLTVCKNKMIKALKKAGGTE